MILAVSYNGLWKLLIDKDINKGDFMKQCSLSGGIMQNLRDNNPVHLKVIERICTELKCNIEDVVEIKVEI